MRYPKCSQLVGFLLLFLGTIATSVQAASTDWTALKGLNRGQPLRVELNDARSYEGELKELDDTGITLRQPAGEQTIARKDIQRLYCRGKDHRVRNMFICAAIGAALAVPADLAYHNNYWPNHGNWIWPVFVVSGGGIGAAIPTGGWHLVYRAHRQREDGAAVVGERSPAR